MRRRLRYIRLSIIYYVGKAIEKVMALIFNIDFVIRHHRRPRYMSKHDLALFKRFLDMKKSGKV